jgi:diacylglycerol kinase (ATP)
MRKALLLYNPNSGRRRDRRVADVNEALSVLSASGVKTSAAPTRAAGDAADQANQAIADGCDTIFACGGDGTIHDVLQGLVGTNVALGVIPLGTANSLANDLGLPTSPAGAARAALTAKPRRVAVGRVEYQDLDGNPASRYFTIAVGVGVDAHLFYKLNPTAKRHLGMVAYCLQATGLWLTHKMRNFAVEIPNGTRPRQATVSELLAVRITDFGGVLRKLAPGASLERDDFRLVLFHTRSRFLYLGYVLRVLFDTRWKVPGVELVNGSDIVCRALDGEVGSVNNSSVYVEADGELLGRLPAKISVQPDSLTLLAP